MALSPVEREFFYQKRDEALTVYNLEKKYMKKRNNGAVYIALEEVNMIWTPKEVGQFDDLWNRGDSLIQIAKTLSRNSLEVALLIMDRELKGKIRPRKGGIWGE